MLQTQQQFLAYLDGVKAELSKARSMEAIEKNIQSIEPLKQNLAEAELIVPVVGAFSAGKSTLINSFLGSECLPVGINPKTALATELRHSASEYIEAVKEDGEADRFALEELDAIHNDEARARQYQYVRVFLNSESLHRILPLVLVDMPGFDAPWDLHHRAILTYLNKGSYYVGLTSVEEGTLTRSIERQLSEIHQVGKEFSVFLSKANLRAPTEVQEIATKIQDRLKDDFELSAPVETLGMDGGETLAKMLKAIDPEKLFAERWGSRLESHSLELDGSLNTCISALQRDSRENQEAIDELAADLQKLQSQKEEMIRDIRTRYSTSRVNTIVEGVGADLEAAVEDLTKLAMSSGENAQSALNREVSEIVRTSLVRHTEEAMDRLHRQIEEDLVGRLNMDSVLGQYSGANSEELAAKVGGLPEVDKILGRGTSSQTKWMYRAVVTTLTITLLQPILGLALFFLPEIIGRFQKRKQEQQIRDQLIGTVIPDVKSKIRSELPKHFEEQVSLLIDEQAKALDSHIQERRSQIAAAEQAKQDEKSNTEQTIAELTTIRDTIRSQAQQAIFT